jgi:mannose-6-phosphate isomerase-like protein (cupin superfamily)
MWKIRDESAARLALAFALCACCAAPAFAQEPGDAEIPALLESFVESYRGKVADSLALVVQFDIGEGPSSWHVTVSPGREVSLGEGASDNAALIFSMSEDTIRDIHEGRMTAFTAGAKAGGGDTAPLELSPGPGAAGLRDPKGTMLSFLQRFFNRSTPERILLEEEHSRVVHGAHVVPLYYAEGLRSAWYMVKKGQRLNEPGDTNPFPQAFVIVSGRGQAKIGDETLDIRAGESYYVPPGSDHVVWTEADEPVVLIWLGWGKGA